jgi:preprotein translocase subunit SecA
LLNIATKIFGTSNERQLGKSYRHVDQINSLESKYESMTDSEIKALTGEFRQRLENGEPLDNLLHQTFAVVREAAKRTLGQRHFDSQLIGGISLHEGKIAEMKTGEGKTLAATLAVYLNGISGKGVHVVTVNDYLAQRDAEWMGQIYNFLGMEVGCITNNTDDAERKKAYEADVTYGTNNEFGFDYLRDNMKFRLEDMVQRDFNFAIVDEIDSILIDEARTPLIISGPSETFSQLYIAIDKIIPELDDNDFDLDEKLKTVNLTDSGSEHSEELLKKFGMLPKDGSMYDAQNITLVHHVSQALRAHKLFSRDTDYIVKDDQVVIIDEFTGRMMEGRRFSDGLHQALEAKEKVKIQNENQTLASITFQNYFRLYPKLSGMTGTAMTEASEFAEIYNLGVVSIPTNVDVIRNDIEDKIYKNLAEKEAAILKQIKTCNDRKQPVLVGTITIEKSEYLSQQLKKMKIEHNILNARYHEREAYIIAQAGRSGTVTIATNMAGRGTDIQLGGNLEMRIKEEVNDEWPDSKKEKAITKIEEEVKQDKERVLEAGGLFVIGTERHESRRIDNQLRGRSGRQGDPGETVFFLSLEDDLMRIFGSEKMEVLLANKHIGLREGEALTHPWISKALERAQGKVEGQNFEIRKNLLKFDNVMNDQRKIIYEQRREIMASEDVSEIITDMRHTVIEDLVARCIPPKTYAEQWDTETLKNEAMRLLSLDIPIEEWAREEGIADEEIIERIIDHSDRKMAKKAADSSTDTFRQIEKSFLLQTLDQSWKEHLLNLDHLRQGISLRAFGQRDPLNEYKAEAFAAFEIMLDQMRENVTQIMGIIEFNEDPESGDPVLMPFQKMGAENELHEGREDPALSQQKSGDVTFDGKRIRPNIKQKPVKRREFDPNDSSTWTKTPRNAQCPCGSEKKYKHCHGKVA